MEEHYEVWAGETLVARCRFLADAELLAEAFGRRIRMPDGTWRSASDRPPRRRRPRSSVPDTTPTFPNFDALFLEGDESIEDTLPS